MRVGLNLVYLVPGQTGGTETYGWELVSALIRLKPDVEFRGFMNREVSAAALQRWKDLLPIEVVPVNATNRLDWVRGEQTVLPRVAAQAQVDLIHSLANTAPLWGPFRRVVTIHDLHHRLVPDAHLGFLRYGMRVLVSAAAHRSDRIIVPSASTGADLMELLQVRPDQIDVVPEGIGTTQGDAIPEHEIRDWLAADGRKIVLSVSAKRPHKNLSRLIEAMALIPSERRPLLVIPGYPTPYEAVLRERVTQLGLTGDVRLTGWIEPERLEGLYATAACLVCASLHEGFGLPVLEAMTRGVPVACSMRGALAEVAGSAAVAFDPESVPQIAAAIERLVGNPTEAARLRELGYARAAAFTWTAAAELTLASYEAAMRSAK